MRLKLTRPHLGENHRQLLAFVFGSHRPEPVGEPPTGYRPFEPRQRPYTPVPTSHRVDARRIPSISRGRIMPRGPQPTSVPGLVPAAHAAPPDELLDAGLTGDPETTMAMPLIGDLDMLVYGTYEDRLVLVDTSIGKLLRAAHATTRRELRENMDWFTAASEKFDRMADELFPPTPPRIPQFDDICAPFATGRRRAPGADRPTVAGLFPALPAAPARHALTGGEK